MGISAHDRVAVLEALDRVYAAVKTAEREADSLAFWTPRSTEDAVRENARQTRKGYEVLKGKSERIESREQVVEFLRSAAAFANVADIIEAAKVNDTGNAVTDIAAKTAEDTKQAAKRTAVIGGPILLLALVAIVAVHAFAGGLARRAGA